MVRVSRRCRLRAKLAAHHRLLSPKRRALTCVQSGERRRAAQSPGCEVWNKVGMGLAYLFSPLRHIWQMEFRNLRPTPAPCHSGMTTRRQARVSTRPAQVPTAHAPQAALPQSRYSWLRQSYGAASDSDAAQNAATIPSRFAGFRGQFPGVEGTPVSIGSRRQPYRTPSLEPARQ